jgi:hypothetical protein
MTQGYLAQRTIGGVHFDGKFAMKSCRYQVNAEWINAAASFR